MIIPIINDYHKYYVFIQYIYIDDNVINAI